MANTFNKVSDWKQSFLSSSVQPSTTAYANGNEFLSSESCIVASGPCKLSSLDGKITTPVDIVPIGLVQNVQVSQQKQIQQMYEIGSRKPFFIPGRTVLSVGLSRILFDGPSLMYALSMQQVNDNGVQLNTWKRRTTTTVPEADDPTSPADLLQLTATDPKPTTDIAINFEEKNPKPGYFFSNLASTFFNKPHGLGFFLFDMEQDAYGGFYLEDCYIQTHSFSISAQQTVLVENVSIRSSNLIPLDAKDFNI